MFIYINTEHWPEYSFNEKLSVDENTLNQSDDAIVELLL